MATLTLRLEAFAKDARQLIAAAQSLADERKNAEVEPLHLLYRAVERQPEVQEAIRRAGVDPEDVLLEAEAAVRRLPRVDGPPSYLSPRMLDLLGRAEGEAARSGGVPVAVPELVIACAQETEGPVRDVLRACGLSAPILRATVERERGGPRPPPEGRGLGRANVLERFGRDLTQMAALGQLDPVVGRDGEIRRILQVLARRNENNPLLVGDAGIGKAAIVRGLARRIARGDVPRSWVGKRIVALETGSLLAGAKLRGELEERMRSLLDAVRDAGGDILLYLPDLAAWSADRGASGAADLLASALGRGELRVIGVTTPEGYRRVLDGQASLAQRFVPIAVEEPTVDATIEILRGIAARFEIEHGVRIGDPALVAAAQLARRYVPGVRLPKSAVDLVDESAARVRVEMESVPAELDRLERRLEAVELQHRSLEDDRDDASVQARARLAEEASVLDPQRRALRARWESELELTGEVRRIREELAAAERELEQARANGEKERANELQTGTIARLEKQLDQANAALTARGEMLVHDAVRAEDVASVVATWTGIPVARMLEEETSKLLGMEDRLRERVVGQDAAVGAISRAVRRGRIGLRDPRRPIGSFLFLGPTGVGKTELAKALAQFLFDDEASLTRLDMSEFMERHMVARLLGSPPGYVDSEEGGFLTEAVRRRPYSVILFDEIEKAHQDVFNILLQVLDDGRLTDSRGRVAYFADTVVILTSNVGSAHILESRGNVARQEVLELLSQTFRPEFLNRIDEVIVFEPLGKAELRGIVEIQLKQLAALLAPRGVTLDVTDAAKERLVELGYEPAFGARPLKRTILRELQDPLAERMLRGEFTSGDGVRVDATKDAFVFERVR